MKNARHLLGFITKSEFKNPISGTLKAEWLF